MTWAALFTCNRESRWEFQAPQGWAPQPQCLWIARLGDQHATERGANAACLKRLRWPRKLCTHRPVATTRIFSVKSADEVRTIEPSGENAGHEGNAVVGAHDHDVIRKWQVPAILARQV